MLLNESNSYQDGSDCFVENSQVKFVLEINPYKSCFLNNNTISGEIELFLIGFLEC